MNRRRIKRSVVTAAVLVGLSVSSQAQAGWFSNEWDSYADSIETMKAEAPVEAKVEASSSFLEKVVIYLLRNGAGKGADYLIGLLLQLEFLDGHVLFDLMMELMANDEVMTDTIMVEMMYSESMVSLIGKSIASANTDAEKQARGTEFFNLAVQRFMPILIKGEIQVDIDALPSSVIAMFSNFGSIESNDDGMEMDWEGLYRSAMSSDASASAFFGLLMQLEPHYQLSMMNYMFLGVTGDEAVHTAESVNTIQAMVEGMMTGLNEGTLSHEALMGLVTNLMPILATFDEGGNMTGLTPYGERFFTVVATKAQMCGDEAAVQFAGMLAGMMPEGMTLPVWESPSICGRVVDPEVIAILNNGEYTYPKPPPPPPPPGEGKTVETLIYFYGEDGVLRNGAFEAVNEENFSDEENLITNVVVKMPGNKSVIIESDMDMLYSDEAGNKFIVSEVLDAHESRFIISMTTDGFGKVFIGNKEGGFEMSGNLAGMKENEELSFSVVETEDGQLAGKTTIRPKDKALTFGSSVFK